MVDVSSYNIQFMELPKSDIGLSVIQYPFFSSHKVSLIFVEYLFLPSYEHGESVS